MIVARSLQTRFAGEQVRAALLAQRKAVYRRWGAVVAATIKRSIRRASRRGERSRPGRPPLAHSDALRGRIFYAVTEDRVIVGPAFRAGSQRRPTVPELLEHGGRLTKRRGTRPTIAARPFVLPAFRSVSVMELWRAEAQKGLDE